MKLNSSDYFMPKEYLDEVVAKTLPKNPSSYVERHLEEKDLVYKHDPLMPSFIIEMWVPKVY